MQYKLVGGAYTEPFKKVNSQTCINWYPHIITKVEQQEHPEKVGYLKPTPGLVEYASVSGTRVRGIFSENDKCFFVVGTTLYELIGDNVTNRGTMANFSPDDGQRVYMNLNGNNQLGIFGGSTAYYYDIDADTLNEITDIDFPGSNGLEYMDGYGLVVRNGRVYFTELNDFSDWRGDSVFTPTYEADNTLRIIKLKGIVWAFGRNTVEPYYNDGTTPFTRTPQASVDIGLLAKDSVAKFETGIFFLGRSRRGSYGVYLLDPQHQVAIVSPGSINQELAKDPQALASAYGFVEQTTDSHIFYHLIIPDTGKTFSYDMLSREWHERRSEAPFPDAQGNKIIAHWRVNGYAEYRGNFLVADYYSGKIFKMDYNTLTEDGIKIRRERAVGVMAEEQKRIAINDFVIDMAIQQVNTSNPQLMFEFSRDGGNNWMPEREIDLPSTGKHFYRWRARKLGSGFNLAFRIRLTDEVNLAIIQASNRGTVGAK